MLTPHQRLYVSSFILDVALTLAFTAAPFYIFNVLGGGAAMSGTIAAAQALCYGIACLITGQLIVHARHSLRWAVAGGIGFSLLHPLSVLYRNPYYFAIVCVVALACLSLYWPAIQSWLGGEPDPTKRARQVAVYNVAWSSGLALGPLLASPLYTRDFRLPFFAVAAIGVIGTVLVVGLPHEKKHFGDLFTTLNETQNAHNQSSEAYLYAAWFANFIGFALIGVTRSVFPKRMDELVGAGQLVLVSCHYPVVTFTTNAVRPFSWLVFVLLFSTATVFYFLGKTHRWQHRLSLVAGCQLAAAAAFWGLGASHSLIVMALCCMIVGINNGVSYCGSLSYSLANPGYKRRRAAIHEAMVGLGSCVGAVSFGYLAESYGVSWPFLMTPVMMLVVALVESALLARGKRRLARLTV